MNCVLFAKMDQVFSLKNTTLKNTGKWKKILEKSRNFVSPEKWEPWKKIGEKYEKVREKSGISRLFKIP